MTQRHERLVAAMRIAERVDLIGVVDFDDGEMGRKFSRERGGLILRFAFGVCAGAMTEDRGVRQFLTSIHRHEAASAAHHGW